MNTVRYAAAIAWGIEPSELPILYIAWHAGFSAYKPPFSPLSYSEGGTPRQPTNRGLLTTVAIGSCLWSFILSLFIQLSTLFSERFTRALSFGLVTGQETFTCGWVRLGRHTIQLREGSHIFPHRYQILMSENSATKLFFSHPEKPPVYGPTRWLEHRAWGPLRRQPYHERRYSRGLRWPPRRERYLVYSYCGWTVINRMW